MKISIIGAGNGGQAMAGHLALMGHDVILYCRNIGKIQPIVDTKAIHLKEAVIGVGHLTDVTDDLGKAILSSEIIMVATTADAHADLAEKMVSFIRKDQIIVLNPGRTGGALEFREVFKRYRSKTRVFIVECQSLIYACRAENPGDVRIIGVKDHVLFSALPSSDLPIVIPVLQDIYKCLQPVENIMITSLENIGAIFHPAIVLFNAAAIERGNHFYFYNDITPHISAFLTKMDKERLQLGKEFGVHLHSVEEWISFAYENIEGDDLYSKLKNNPAYYKIMAPKAIHSRLLLEDIPTGIVPMIELGKIVGLEMPIMRSICKMAETLLQIDFSVSGRTLDKLGLKGKSKEEILHEL